MKTSITLFGQFSKLLYNDAQMFDVNHILQTGGLLLIAEMVPNDTRTGPALSLLFGLNMLLHTEQGDVFTMREYRKWLKEAGFKKVTAIEAPAPSPLILATK